MAEDRKLFVIYPTPTDKNLFDTDFYTLLSFIKSNRIKYQRFKLNFKTDRAVYFKELAEKIKNEVVYFYISDLIYLDKIRKFLSVLRKYNPLIILGGAPSITIKAVDILNHFNSIDIIVRAPEDEKVLVYLVKGIWKNRDWEFLKGITFRKSGSNKVISTKNLPLSKDLDHLSNFGIYDEKFSCNEWYPIITSRGCNYNCQYCGYQVPYRVDYETGINFWRKKSEKKVVDEIESLISKGIKKFSFRCNQFFTPKELSEENNSAVLIAKEILKRKLKLKFNFSLKSSEIKRNFDSLFLLREAGMETIDIRIDSGIGQFHQIYETSSNVNDTVEVLKRMHEHGFNFDISFIFFDPYLSIDGIKKNISFLGSIEEYFSHLSLPYSAYLDSRVLNSVLILRYGMPIIRKLKNDNLVVESPDFSNHPAAKFNDSKVKYVYSIYKALNKTALPRIRPFYYNKILVEKYNFINLFPLRLLEKILAFVVENKFEKLSDYVQYVETYIKKTFRPKIENMLTDFIIYRNESLEKWINHSSIKEDKENEK